ncbi:MAG: MATE family efflux transporter [Fusobacteriaceae bacterium]|nr:MATE family efflux transporter [Fusobacteriaceae bacterium]MBN2837479.1 MATE family efflux transporter [Fusobacteriaceae bacterium]
MKLDFENEKVNRLLIKYAVPSIIGGLVFALYNIVDRIYIGRGVGTYALSALSLTFPLFNIIAGVTAFISVGATAKIGLKLGERKKNEAEKILGNVFSIFFVMSIILTILGNIYLDKLLYFLGANETTFSFARDYLKILINVLFFMLFPFGLIGLMQAEGNPKKSMIAGLIGAIANLLLDPLFIFYFNLGIKGASLATALSNILVALFVIHHFTISKKRNLTLKKENLVLNIKLVTEVMKIGISPFLRKIATSITILVINKSLINYGGSSSVAVLGIIDTISSIIFIVIMGISEGAQPIISYNYGAKNYKRVKETISKALIISFIIGTIALISVYYSQNYIIYLFTKDIKLEKEIKDALIIYMLMTPLLGFHTLGVNFFQAIDRSSIAVFLNLFRKVFLLIPLIIILSKFFGTIGIWYANPLSDFISTFVTFYFLKREFKIFKIYNKIS